MLIQCGVATALDVRLLALYCQLHALWTKCHEQLLKDGPTVKTPHGVKRHPAYGVASDAAKQMTSILRDFGLTPASRNRVTPSENIVRTAADEKCEAILFGGETYREWNRKQQANGNGKDH